MGDTATEKEDKPQDSADKPLRKTGLAAIRRLLFRRLPPDEAKEVRQAVETEGALSERYVLMCALSAGIATLGLLQSSTAVVIGAMLVSPLMSPIAALGFAFASVEGRRAQKAAKVLGVGVIAGIAVGMTLTWLSPIRNATPEIIARTAPTLLDLAVAVLSGVAGGYATVHRKGETAIGVAIATALMPPLATVGYSLAVARFDFAGGAMLLFLTNLGAIAFSFALVARIRGVARPFARVDFKPIHVTVMIGAFLLLATPLALTLARVARETQAVQTAREAVLDELKIDAQQIAQLTATWDGARPRIAATVIVTRYDADAQAHIRARLLQTVNDQCQFDLRQIVAADPQSQTQAMVEAALAELPANVRARLDADPDATRADEAPVTAAVAATRLAIISSWPDTSVRRIMLLPAPAVGVSLSDLRAEEARLNRLGLGWEIAVVPPPQDRIAIYLGEDAGAFDADQAKAIDDVNWALMRWSASQPVVEGVAGATTTSAARTTAQARADAVAEALRGEGRTVTAKPADKPIIDRADTKSLTRVDVLPFG